MIVRGLFNNCGNWNGRKASLSRKLIHFQLSDTIKIETGSLAALLPVTQPVITMCRLGRTAWPRCTCSVGSAAQEAALVSLRSLRCRRSAVSAGSAGCSQQRALCSQPWSRRLPVLVRNLNRLEKFPVQHIWTNSSSVMFSSLEHIFNFSGRDQSPFSTCCS